MTEQPKDAAESILEALAGLERWEIYAASYGSRVVANILHGDGPWVKFSDIAAIIERFKREGK